MAQRFIILGAGRFGTHLAARLSEFGCEVVLADQDANRVAELAEDGFNILEMDVADEDALKEAGVQDADAVVVSIGENIKGSVLATLLLKELQVKKIIARALDAKHAQVLEKLGADIVVLPTRDMAYRLAEQMRDDAQDERHPLHEDYQLAKVRLGLRLHGQSLAMAKLPKTFGVTAVLIIRGSQDKETEAFEPAADFMLQQGDLIMIVGRREKINRFENACGLMRHHEP
jgi:trk system potassium uptake protein TrkA